MPAYDDEAIAKARAAWRKQDRIRMRDGDAANAEQRHDALLDLIAAHILLPRKETVMPKYLTHSRFEKNANNGLCLHETADDAADAAQMDRDAGGTVTIYECREVRLRTVTRVTGVDLVDPMD